MTFKRITYASHSNRDSQFPDINADGTKIVFMSDSDFLSQGIPYNKNEVWLYQPATSVIYLPVVTHDVNSNSVIWNGVWETDCGLGACGEMNLAHIGNIVIGTYADGDGALFGVVSGNGLSGTWSRSGASGTFDFWIEGSGNRWHGNFDKTSPWCGRRAGESYLSPCGVSSWYGTWTTNCGISACGDMILQQSGDSVAGTYAAGDGVLAGTVNGSELTGTWTRGVGIGTFKMFMLPNGDQFNGNWDLTNAWCGFRNAVGDPVPCLRN